ncbi:P-loop ATPase, Sll1717 family [Cryobacterium sp. AP23]
MPELLPQFSSLRFGHLDATQEASEEPELLRTGYYDYRQAVQGILQGQYWLILGPKGSGKSAVLENIRLTWEHRWNRFFNYWNLAGFPVNDVTRIQTGQSQGGSRSQSAWEFLLLLRVVETLSRDEGLNASGSFVSMVKALKAGGFITSNWLGSVSKWSNTKIKFDAKIIGAEAQFDAASITPLDVSAYIREQLFKTSTESSHIIAIDGLDSFFFEAEDEWTSLAGLMQAIWTLNRDLRAAKLPVTVVAAARSDIVDMLPGPEINKLKPHSVHLDWHANGIGAKNQLWTLVSRKVSVTKPQVTNVVTQYLRTSIEIGPHRELAEYLLDNTRLLPRDLVALMTYLQRTYRGKRQVTEEAAKRAVQLYAEEYFVGEIFDNLAGVLDAGNARHLASFKDALRTAPSRLFTFAYVCEELQGELEPTQVKQLLKQMFETGGIGIKNGSYTDFVFRKIAGAGFTTRYEFMLHDALTRAWGRPWR